LQGSLGVFLCNVKASKMRGVFSQGRLLCCSASDVRVELLVPPSGSVPGDRITFLNYPGEPDRELSSKQKIWELLQPDMQVDTKGVANYKGCGFEALWAELHWRCVNNSQHEVRLRPLPPEIRREFSAQHLEVCRHGNARNAGPCLKFLPACK
ncbi:hypothetical protein GOODEAATRI_030898, partial [Goodea atripinnis]